MNPASYEFLPAPLWLITVLHLLTLTLHFVAVGALFGGLGALLLVRGPEKWRHAGVASLVRLLPTLMALTVTLGVAPLLFLQLVYHRQVYAAAIVSAWFWLGMVGAVIVAYSLLYAAALRTRSDTSSTARQLGVALVALLFVSLVLSSVLTLAERPAALAAAWAVDPSGTVLNPEIGRWLPRWLHLVAGALTLGSFALLLFVRADARLAAAARTSTLWSMVAAILLGFGALAGLGEQIVPYMRSPAVWWMTGSLLFALGALHFLYRGRFLATGLFLFLSLAGMVVQRHLARLVVLKGAFDPGAIAVRPQWGVFALFVLCFVAMLGVVGWMLRLFFAPGASRAEA